MMAPLLKTLENIPARVERASYDPLMHKIGMVHFGLGAFHKSHQAFYTDAAIEASGGDWRIFGVSLRDTEVSKRVNAQNGLYTLITKGRNAVNARIISSIAAASSAVEDSTSIRHRLYSPDTRVVSLTITEKGYGIDRSHGGIDVSNQILSGDLQSPENPKSAIGFIVNALQTRRQTNVKPFTVLCCDNLPHNGSFLRKGVLDFAQRIDAQLAHWIAEYVPFPATMVDRITPAQSAQTVQLAEELTAHRDYLAIETEPFHQWVIEDTFANGRPDWAAAGAVFTDDVAPYETMKLRMLNGAHSMLAYGGFLAGHRYVRDVMTDKSMSTLIARHMQAASRTLPEIAGFDATHYAAALVERFANPAIAHETCQIAADGSQKLPQRIFEPALAAIDNKDTVRPFAFAAALWMHYCRGTHPDAGVYVIHDPARSSLQSAANSNCIEEIMLKFSKIPGLIPQELSSHPNWIKELDSVLTDLNELGIRTTLDKEAAMPC